MSMLEARASWPRSAGTIGLVLDASSSLDSSPLVDSASLRSVCLLVFRLGRALRYCETSKLKSGGNSSITEQILFKRVGIHIS